MTADSLHYRLVYDVAAAGYTDWWFPAAGLIGLAVFGFGLYRALRDEEPLQRSWIYILGLPFLTVWVLGAFWGTYGDYTSIRDRLNSGRYILVEGVVQQFQDGDAGDHDPERWMVRSGDTVYRYSYVRSQLSPGFRHEAIHGGPIRNGLHVRIADVDGHIARLEIADATASASR